MKPKGHFSSVIYLGKIEDPNYHFLLQTVNGLRHVNDLKTCNKRTICRREKVKRHKQINLPEKGRSDSEQEERRTQKTEK